MIQAINLKPMYQPMVEGLSAEARALSKAVHKESLSALFEHFGQTQVIQIIRVEAPAEYEYQPFAINRSIKMKAKVNLKGKLGLIKTDPIDKG